VNYAVVGAFVLLLGALLVAGLLWLASGGANQPKYDLFLAIEDESVAGLSVNAPVKFNGVDVGKVRDIKLDPARPERVRLLFAIERGTPIKVDTVAVLKTQGLTGIAYVELSGGSNDAATLITVAPELYPVILTKPSLSTRLENVLTAVLSKMDQTSGNIDALLSEANQEAVRSTLADVALLARTMAARKDTLDAGITDAGRTLALGARAAAKLGPVIDDFGRSAAALTDMGTQTALTSRSAGETVDRVGADLQQFTADTLPELQGLMSEMRELSASLRRLTEQTERNPASLLFGQSPVPPGPGETAR